MGGWHPGATSHGFYPPHSLVAQRRKHSSRVTDSFLACTIGSSCPTFAVSRLPECSNSRRCGLLLLRSSVYIRSNLQKLDGIPGGSVSSISIRRLIPTPKGDGI